MSYMPRKSIENRSQNQLKYLRFSQLKSPTPMNRERIARNKRTGGIRPKY